MGKAKSSFINMFLTLLTVCVLAGVALAAVYQATETPIRQSKESQQQAAVKEVLPPFDDLKTEKKAIETKNIQSIFYKPAPADSLTLYHAFRQGKEVGTAVETFSTKGFGGTIRLMAGFTPEGSIFKVAVLNHSETPGLGSKMTEPAFYSQFEGKNPKQFKLRVKKDGGDVQAITAATISSRAYCDAMETAYSSMKSE